MGKLNSDVAARAASGGITGYGIPPGGAKDQVIAKNSSADGDAGWVTIVSIDDVTAAINDAINSGMHLNLDLVSGDEDGSVSFNVLANDTTSSGSLTIMQFTIAGVTGIFLPGNTATISGVGSIRINSDGSGLFTPVANYNGTVPAVTYIATNGSDLKAKQLVITITPVADAPVAVDDMVSGAINATLTLNVASNDTSIDGGSLNVTHINGTPVAIGGSVTLANGTVTRTASTTLSIVPTTGFTGSFTFAYTLTDGSNGLTATANITANFVNPEAGATGDYFISPNGSDSNNGTTAATPWKTFAYAFAHMAQAKTLVLMDGTYDPSTTGIIHWDTGIYSARSSNLIPNGTSRAAKTEIIARNAGRAVINGPLFMGRSARKDSYINFDGLRFEGGGQFYNTSFNVLKRCAMHGPFSIGTNDHDNGNTDNLVEDCWIWAAGQRGIAMNYRGHRNTWRRVIVRGDGCGTSACSGSANPNIGITCYDSHDVELLNIMVVDRILAGTDSGYGDFACASHTGGLYMWGNNAWRGCISLNAPDSAWYVEPDVGTTIDPTWTIENCAAIRPAGAGFNFAREGTHVTATNLLALMTAGDGFRLAPELAGSNLIGRNVVVAGAGTRALNSPIALDYVCINGTWSQGVYGSYNPDPTHVLTTNPIGTAIKYPTRIEAGSFLAGAGYGGADLGPTILKRYGADGAIYGDADRTTLQLTDLWPWPNEDRIKSDMSEVSTRGFCAWGTQLDGVNPITLTSYVWESLGYPMPSTVYPPTSVPVNLSPPVATGQFVEGATLTTTYGTWSNLPTGYAVAWLRDGTPIAGATSTTYTLQASDIGHQIAPRVIASNSVGSSSPSTGTANTIAAATALSAGTVTITGSLFVTNTLTVNPGSWGGAPSPTWSVQIYRDGVAFGSPSSSLTFVPTLPGGYTAVLTGTNIKGSITASPSASVTVAALPVPVNTAAPSITGTAAEGQTITGWVGSWTNSPTSYTYTFMRDGVPISGTTSTGTATGTTYALTSADVGKSITFSVVATNAGGDSSAATSSGITPTASTTIGDDFTGTNGTDIAGRTATGIGGFTWTKNANFTNSTIVIDTNAVRASAAASLQPYYAGTAPSSANQTVSASISFGTSPRQSMALGARMSTDANTDGYYASHSGGGEWQLFKRVGGTTTVLGTASDGGSGGTFAVDLVCNGSSISVKINGTTVITATDTSITAPGRVGILSWYADTAGSDLIDTFIATWS